MQNFLAICLFFLGVIMSMVGYTALDKKIRIYFLFFGILSILVAIYFFNPPGYLEKSPNLPANIIFEL